MKFFAFIMSCIILIASVTPCKDSAALNQQNDTVTIQASSNHDCTNSGDVCSPLCICNCCAGCSMYYSFPEISGFNAQSHVNYASFLNNITREVALPIWQPPQLS